MTQVLFSRCVMKIQFRFHNHNKQAYSLKLKFTFVVNWLKCLGWPYEKKPHIPVPLKFSSLELLSPYTHFTHGKLISFLGQITCNLFFFVKLHLHNVHRVIKIDCENITRIYLNILNFNRIHYLYFIISWHMKKCLFILHGS